MLVWWPTLTQGLWGAALASLASKSDSSLFSQCSLQLSSPKAYGTAEAVSKQGHKNPRQRPESHHDSSSSRYPFSFLHHCVFFLNWTMPPSIQKYITFPSHLTPLSTHSVCSRTLDFLTSWTYQPLSQFEGFATCCPQYGTENVF